MFGLIEFNDTAETMIGWGLILFNVMLYGKLAVELLQRAAHG